MTRITYAIELFNGNDVTFLSDKTDRFIKTLSKSRRFESREIAEHELEEQKKRHGNDIGNFYVATIISNH